MRFSPIRAAIEIARLDQEEATFLEIFSDWINEDGNRERLVRLFDNGLSAGNPFEGVCFNREELIAFLAHDGMTHVRFGGMQDRHRPLFHGDPGQYLRTGLGRSRGSRSAGCDVHSQHRWR
jgi:hypothetical protein